MQPNDFTAFIRASALFKMNLVQIDALIDAATSLLDRGVSTDTVITLACATPGELRREEADQLADRILAEAAQPALSAESARQIVIATIARDIAEGNAEAYDGARAVAGLIRSAQPPVPDTQWQDLAPFVALVDDWEEFPEQRPAIETDIRAAAADLIANRPD